jgi:homoserine O-acetyltransferase
MRKIILLGLLLVCGISKAQVELPTIPLGLKDAKQQYASLGDFNLQNGQKIIDCKIGYRTYGKLNSEKSNVVVFLCGLANTSALLETFVPKFIVDSTKYHVILIDALGNGVSSSPSNSIKQPRMKFPEFNVADMVETQHKVLTEKLGINHVLAVGGISMGALQTYQWAVNYPVFMDKVICIAGTTKFSSYDMLWANLALDAIQSNPQYKNGNFKREINIPSFMQILQLAYSTPDYISTKIKNEDFENWYKKSGEYTLADWNDIVRQMQCALSYDIVESKNSSLEETAKIVQAKMLVVVNKQDHAINYLASKKFAELTKATKYIELDASYGHSFQVFPLREIRALLAE